MKQDMHESCSAINRPIDQSNRISHTQTHPPTTQPELVSSRRQGRRQLQTTDAPTAAAVPTPAPSAPTTMAPTVVPTPGNHTAAPTAALTAPPTPTPPAPSPTPPPPKPQPEPTGDGSEPHGLTAGQKVGAYERSRSGFLPCVCISVVVDVASG